jgi:hypothetical protein
MAGGKVRGLPHVTQMTSSVNRANGAVAIIMNTLALRFETRKSQRRRYIEGLMLEWWHYPKKVSIATPWHNTCCSLALGQERPTSSFSVSQCQQRPSPPHFRPLRLDSETCAHGLAIGVVRSIFCSVIFP